MSGSKSFFREDLQVVLSTVHLRTRRMVWGTAAIGFVAGLLEAVGVGAIVPLVMLMTEPDIAGRFPAAARFIPQTLLENRQALILTGTSLFALFFLLKSGLTLLVSYLQSSLLGRLSAELSSGLFADYLRRPYTFHLHRNASDINTRLIFGVRSAVDALHGVSQLLVEGIAVLAIAALLLYVNVAAALVTIAVIGLPAYAVYKVLRRRLRKIGADMHHLNTQATESTLHALGGIKELKILGREAVFHATYDQARARLGKVEAHYGVLQVAPRLVLELATVFSVLGLASVLAVQGQVAAIVPVLGLYAAAAFRVLPAANRLLMAMQMIRLSEAGLHKVAEDLSALVSGDKFSLPGPSRTSLRLVSELLVEGVSYSYGSGEKSVLHNINLNIRVGECVGFAGPSGAGKSTLVDLLLGVLTPDEGRITADGMDLHTRLRDWQAGIGYVPQSIFLLDDTIRANVAYGIPSGEIDDALIWQALEAAQLTSFLASLPIALETRVGERGVRISGGQRQRIGIARALYHNPGVLILDEATSSLDNATESSLMDAVFGLRGRKTIIIVAHRLTTIERCDRIFLLDHGRLAGAGSYDELLVSSPTFARIAHRRAPTPDQSATVAPPPEVAPSGAL